MGKSALFAQRLIRTRPGKLMSTVNDQKSEPSGWLSLVNRVEDDPRNTELERAAVDKHREHAIIPVCHRHPAAKAVAAEHVNAEQVVGNGIPTRMKAADEPERMWLENGPRMAHND